MDDREDAIRSFTAVADEAAAVSHATLTGDFDEARFRAQLLVVRADAAGFTRLAVAAAELSTLLGHSGAKPSSGFGAGVLRMADELDKVALV